MLYDAIYQVICHQTFFVFPNHENYSICSVVVIVDNEYTNGGSDSSSFFFNITFQKQQLNVCLEQMYGYKFVCRDQRNV